MRYGCRWRRRKGRRRWRCLLRHGNEERRNMRRQERNSHLVQTIDGLLFKKLLGKRKQNGLMKGKGDRTILINKPVCVQCQ